MRKQQTLVDRAIDLPPPLSMLFRYTTWTQVHHTRTAGLRGGQTTKQRLLPSLGLHLRHTPSDR